MTRVENTSHKVGSMINASKKCKFLFKIRSRPLKYGKGWIVKVARGVNNHQLVTSLQVHPFLGRLTVEERSIEHKKSKYNIAQRHTYMAMKD